MSKSCTVIVLLLIVPISGCWEDINRAARETSEGIFGVKDERTQADLLEINAVARLNSDTAKFEGFMAIASRSTHDPLVQTHLVKRSIESLYSEKDKQAVLEKLMEGRFTCAAKKEVLLRLDQFKTNEVKTAILTKINNISDCYESQDEQTN